MPEVKFNTAVKSNIVNLAKSVGFDTVRFTSPNGLEKNAAFFNQFIEDKFFGEMKWMENKKDWRTSPSTLWPETSSIIMLGMNYGPAHNPLDRLIHKNNGNISVYAKGKDYHDIIKKRLKQIARTIHREHNVAVKVFVDTAPVMEKPLAAKSGMGWQGKHTNLVSREFGSWLFLGSIFTTLEIEPDEKEKDHCGSCQSCLDICPTNAFPSPYRLDARKCISYLTIEYKGHIAEEFRKPMGNRIYGCDDCLSICPWNKYAQLTNEAHYYPRIEIDFPNLSDLADLDDPSFRTFFSGSPIKRIGRDYFIRNVLIAIGNSNDRKHIPLLKRKLHDHSPYVRAMAVWALKQLCSDDEFMTIKQKHSKTEQDNNVLNEF